MKMHLLKLKDMQKVKESFVAVMLFGYFSYTKEHVKTEFCNFVLEIFKTFNQKNFNSFKNFVNKFHWNV